MRIVIAGGTGFIGTALIHELAKSHHEIIVLSRNPHNTNLPLWVKVVDGEHLPTRADAVVNLAGESILGRWTKSKKQRVLNSRVQSTRSLVDWMAGMPEPPKVFLCASAVGYYGDRGSQELTERSAPDPAMRFRARVCVAWEGEAQRAATFGTRVVSARLGAVLDRDGGFFCTILRYVRSAPFLMRVAPEAYLPWISLTDATRLIDWSLCTPSVQGAINMTGPTEATYDEVAKAIGARLNKRVLGRVPNAAITALLGQQAQGVIESQRVKPAKALELGFRFEHRHIQECLDSMSL